MLKIYDHYVMKQILLVTLIAAGSLAMIILLTQSNRLIALVLESNASSASFFAMMALSWPRFMEATLPASMLIATIFVLNRLTTDSETTVMRATGASPMNLAKPVLIAGAIMIALLLALSLWISPTAITKMQTLRQEVRTQYSHLLFREGVFNTMGRNLTAYVQARGNDGQLIGLMVHDTRGTNPITVVAKSGQLVTEGEHQKILVYNGSRQEDDSKTGKFSRLDFKQYTLDIPASSDDGGQRWREPDERTIGELINTEALAKEAPADQIQFKAELHRRITTPILMLAFALMGAAFMINGPFSRKGQMPVIIAASLAAIMLQSLYLLAYNTAKKDEFSNLWLYALSAGPLVIAIIMLSPTGERLLAFIEKRMRHL